MMDRLPIGVNRQRLKLGPAISGSTSRFAVTFRNADR